ncbi:hypothetical protein PYW08_001539 [Mythimna loreyi]|uniref:Uncharacterized protein n=1 Tax=Mythimna loreyi TaxID=667449 RepID=A0ACC2R9L6_9NEOP|nr:hypothetical protein PYW08_001539 [Mythimna loreyi]
MSWELKRMLNVLGSSTEGMSPTKKQRCIVCPRSKDIKTLSHCNFCKKNHASKTHEINLEFLLRKIRNFYLILLFNPYILFFNDKIYVKNEEIICFYFFLRNDLNIMTKKAGFYDVLYNSNKVDYKI